MEKRDGELLELRKDQNKRLLLEDGISAKAYHEEALALYELLKRTGNKRIFNEKRPEIIKLEYECIKIAKELSESTHQRLTMLRKSYTELESDLKTKQESQSFKLKFGS